MKVIGIPKYQLHDALLLLEALCQARVRASAPPLRDADPGDTILDIGLQKALRREKRVDRRDFEAGCRCGRCSRATKTVHGAPRQSDLTASRRSVGSQGSELSRNLAGTTLRARSRFRGLASRGSLDCWRGELVNCGKSSSFRTRVPPLRIPAILGANGTGSCCAPCWSRILPRYEGQEGWALTMFRASAASIGPVTGEYPLADII